MNSPIKFQTALTKDDFIKASRGYIASQFNNQVFGILLLLPIFGGILGLIRNGIEPTILSFVILASFGLFYSYILSPIIGASTISQNSQWNAEFDWSVTVDEIIINSRSLGAKVGWSLYQDFIEPKEFFLLIDVENKKSFQAIPKRSFSTTEQEEGFRLILKERFATKRKSFFIKNWRTILFILIILSVNLYVMFLLGNNP